MRLAPCLTAILLLSLVPSGPANAGKSARGKINIDGETVDVTWSDGDSFRFKAGPYRGKGTRLLGYNTLEGFGPVHRWGTWTPGELFDIANECAAVAASQVWNCTTEGKADGYGRVLVRCPDLALEMVSRDLAFAFAVDEPASPALLAAQRKARESGVGMWKKGTPKRVVTSLHSTAEKAEKRGKASDKPTYNRVVDLETGRAEEATHDEEYATCQEVCVGKGEQASCMVYVPFQNRYRDRPACLRSAKPVKEVREEPAAEGEAAEAAEVQAE